jgi:deoxyribonuclease-4
LFTKNSNRWAAKELFDSDIDSFRRIRKATHLNPVFAHCSYLMNLASDGELYEKSVRALVTEIERAENLGLDFVVLHPGAHCGKGEKEGLKRIVDALQRALYITRKMKCKIAIENTAGQGSCMGHKLQHLEYISAHIHSPNRIGFCIDTCHLFASGYDIRTKKTYAETFRLLLESIPLTRVLAFHLNDSRKPLGSRVDRHQHIGKGYIGTRAFRYLLNDARFQNIPKVLETPKGKDLAEDVMNLISYEVLWIKPPGRQAIFEGISRPD